MGQGQRAGSPRGPEGCDAQATRRSIGVPGAAMVHQIARAVRVIVATAVVQVPGAHHQGCFMGEVAEQVVVGSAGSTTRPSSWRGATARRSFQPM